MRDKLSGKDLITIGIFAAIYFVINFIFMLLGGVHPLLWILMPSLIAVFAAVPILIMASKVQKFGTFLITGLITGLIYFATGQFTIVILTTFALACISAEIVRKITNYSSFKGNAIAYILFCFGMVGSPLPLWIYKGTFLKQIEEQGIPTQYLKTLESYLSTNMLIIMFLAIIVGGVLGVFIAKGILRKNFKEQGY